MITIAGYPIDVAVTEEHGSEAEITDHPVEKGGNVTDHMRVKPATVAIEGIVSDTPLGEVALDPSRLGSTAPSDDAHALLVKIQNDREPVAITTSLGRYENMELQSLSAPRDARTGKALRFRATFKQVTFVTNKRTTVRTAAPRSRGKSKHGMKPSPAATTVKAPVGTSGGDGSWAAQIIDYIAG
jgi:hypothetical protein